MLENISSFTILYHMTFTRTQNNTNKPSVLVRQQGDVHQALIVVQKGVAQCFPDDQPPTDPRSLHTKGKAMLLVGRFMEETANFESNAIMKAYKVTALIFFY